MRRAAAAAAMVLLLVYSVPVQAQQAPPMGATGASTVTAPAREGSIHDGAYVGLTGGLSASQIGAGDIDWSDQSYFGGAYIGYGVVVERIYVGVEADALWRDLRVSASDGAATATISNRWMGSLRGRLGIPMGSALIYGTAGIAVQDAAIRYLEPGLLDSDSKWGLGFVGGGGIEAQLTRTMHLRIEGLHYRWRDQGFSLLGQEVGVGHTDNVIRVGIGFKLN